MPKKRITQKIITSLRSISPKQLDIHDTLQPGFGVRAFATGKKSFFFLYRNIHGQRRRYNIGDTRLVSLSDARKKAKLIASEVAQGGDPQGIKAAFKTAETVGELAAQFLAHSNKNNKPKTYREDWRIFEKDILPLWRNHKLASIRRKDVIALLERIDGRGAPVMANRTQQLLSRFFSFAEERELIEQNPCYRLKKIAKERTRDRVLTLDELRLLLFLLDHCENRTAAGALKMILLTLQRSSEVKGMRWSEIEGNIWTIPAERMKNGKPHTIPLSDAALTLLEEMRCNNRELKRYSRKANERKTHYDEFVFPSRKDGSMVEINKRFKRIINSVDGIEDCTIHDLRRTGSTYLQEMGVSGDVIERILSHSLKGVAATYQRSNRMPQMKVALDRWAERLKLLQTTPNIEKNKVVAIR